jgi:putative transcriptional regulator
MPIIVNLDVVLAQRKMRLNDLAQAVDITPQNLSILKTGKAKAIRFSTLEAICRYLNCQPGDILEYREDSLEGKESESGKDNFMTESSDGDVGPRVAE